MPTIAPGDGNDELHTTISDARDTMRAGTFRFWGLCFLGGGTAAVLVDFDHIPRYVFNAYWLSTPFNVFHFSPGRFLHPALFFVSSGVLACVGGLLLVMVLSGLYRELSGRRAVQARQSVVKLNGSRSGRVYSGGSAEVPGTKKIPSKAGR